jgi:hypothetical protein
MLHNPIRAAARLSIRRVIAISVAAGLAWADRVAGPHRLRRRHSRSTVVTKAGPARRQPRSAQQSRCRACTECGCPHRVRPAASSAPKGIHFSPRRSSANLPSVVCCRDSPRHTSRPQRLLMSVCLPRCRRPSPHATLTATPGQLHITPVSTGSTPALRSEILAHVRFTSSTKYEEFLGPRVAVARCRPAATVGAGCRSGSGSRGSGWAGWAMTIPPSSIPNRWCSRASGLGAHQFHLPITRMKAGTSTNRTRVASTITASVRPTPNIRMNCT